MNINPNPHFISEEEEAKGYRAIARLVLFWGPIELHVENMIVSLRNAQHETDGSFPVSFSRKLDELKDRLKREIERDADLAQIQDAIRPLLGRSKELHVMRTHVAHSYFQGQGNHGELMFGRSDQKRGVSYTEARYTIPEIEAATVEMIQIHDALSPHAHELFRYVPKAWQRENKAKIARASGKADQ